MTVQKELGFRNEYGTITTGDRDGHDRLQMTFGNFAEGRKTTISLSLKKAKGLNELLTEYIKSREGCQ